jgi:cation transporter-like permease
LCRLTPSKGVRFEAVDHEISRLRRQIVTLLIYYLVFMVAGDFVAYFLGRFVEYEWGSHASLVVFLALYFLFLWVSWVLAVRVTKPKVAELPAA